MNTLVISNYDMYCNFTVVALEDSKEVDRIETKEGLKKYGLYDPEWLWFERKLISKNNKFISQFDIIILCEDGGIEFFRRGDNY